jgi:site-specific DNA recombinase
VLAVSERLAYALVMANGRTRVVGYVRVSTEKQADEGVSLAAQRAKLTAYAVAMDLDLVAIIEDAGVSAKSLDREGLRSALAMLDTGKADALVVVKLDRLTRSVRDLGDLVERYFASRCSLLSLSDAIDNRTAAGRLVLNVLTSVAQWEREATGERTREAMKHKASRGEFTGGHAPYGYSVAGDGTLIPNDAEQAVLHEVAELRAAGLSLRGIAAELDRAGLRARSGKPFDAKQIERMTKGARAA